MFLPLQLGFINEFTVACRSAEGGHHQQGGAGHHDQNYRIPPAEPRYEHTPLTAAWRPKRSRLLMIHVGLQRPEPSWVWSTPCPRSAGRKRGPVTRRPRASWATPCWSLDGSWGRSPPSVSGNVARRAIFVREAGRVLGGWRANSKYMIIAV